MNLSQYQQPDVTTVRIANPLARFLVLPIQIGYLANLFMHSVFSGWSTTAAFIVLALLSIVLFICFGWVIFDFGSRWKVVLSYAALAVVIPCLYWVLISTFSPWFVFVLLFPVALFGLRRVVKDMVFEAAAIKAAHPTVPLQTRVLAAFYINQLSDLDYDEDLRDFLRANIKRIRHQQVEIIVQAEEINQKYVKSTLRFDWIVSFVQLAGFAAVLVIALFLLDLLPRYSINCQAFALLFITVLFVGYKLRRISPVNHLLNLMPLAKFAGRYFTESPPHDVPTTYIPASGDLAQRVAFAAAVFFLTTVAVTTAGYFFPILAPVDQFAFELDNFAQFEDVTVQPVDLRENAYLWMPRAWDLEANPLLTFATFILSIALCQVIPLLIIFAVALDAADIARFFDELIAFVPKE